MTEMSPFQQRATEILDRPLHQDTINVLERLKEIVVVIQQHVGDCLYVSVSPDLCVHIDSHFNPKFHEVLIEIMPEFTDSLFPLRVRPENELCSNINELESALLRKMFFVLHWCTCPKVTQMKEDKWLHDGDSRTQILKRGFVAGWHAYHSREKQKLEWQLQKWEGDAKTTEPTFEAEWNEVDFVEITDEIKSNFNRFLWRTLAFEEEDL